MDQFDNKTAINQKNPDDRVDALNALRRKTSQLIKDNPIALRDINQEAVDAALTTPRSEDTGILNGCCEGG